MYYRLYKLRFLTPVRFGADSGAGLPKARIACHADTLFSALCTEAAAYGGKALDRLVEAARAGRLLLTDLFPYRGLSLYLPRPFLPPVADGRARQRTLRDARQAAERKKQLKKLPYLPVSQMESYLHWLRKGGDFPVEQAEFGAFVTMDKVNTREGEPLPYHVQEYHFAEDCGLYFIVGASDGGLLDLADRLLESLGYAGIGGKRSSGGGKFQLADDPLDMDEQGWYGDDGTLYTMLTADRADWYMTLSVVWPTEEELPSLADAFYSLVRRGGFVNSPSYASQAVKRHSVHMINAGSCLKTKAAGQVGDLSAGGAHAVYRYGKGFYAGLKV